jgi:signal transduction histidine kinase
VFIILTSVTSYVIQRQVFEWTTQESISNYIQERQRRTFIFVEETLRPFPQEEWPARFDALTRRLGTPARLVPIDALAANGELDAGSVEKLRAGVIHSQPLGTEPTTTGAVLYRTVLDSNIVAALEVPPPPQPRVFGIFRPVVFTWMVECSLFAIAILLWLRLFWRDLRRLSQAAEAIGDGTFPPEVPLKNGSALRPLADSFNRMSHRIKALVNSHRELTTAVSHELKTPLARLRFAMSLLPEQPTLAERDRLIAKMQRDVDELEELVQEMLTYSRLERETPHMHMASLPVDAWLPDAVEDEIEAAMAHDVSLPVAVASTVDEAACEPKFMARAVRNLVRNALRFARGRVEVNVLERDGSYTIHVDDDGPGIAPSDRARLFVPFSRLDASRSRHSGGSGLGLAIVRRVAEWHGGTATIDDSPLGGARISIHWPVAGIAKAG